MIEVSVIICTYNRAEILKCCLKSLVAQTANKESFEVIVVDNMSDDNTKEIVDEYAQSFSNFQYIIEKQIGLSYCRNTGYQNAKSDWIAYIDDDAKAYQNFVERILSNIHNYNFDFLGGKYYPWFLYPKKKWLPEDIGLKKDIVKEIGVIASGYATGCNMLIKKELLLKFGGFNPNLGMTGKKVAYGEETELQDTFREAGYTIWYDPQLCVDHLVGKHKLSLHWHLKSQYAYGRDNYRMWKTSNPNIAYLLKTIAKSIVTFPHLFIKVLSKRSYYWQNMYLDTLKPIFQAFGEFIERKRE